MAFTWLMMTLIGRACTKYGAHKSAIDASYRPEEYKRVESVKKNSRARYFVQYLDPFLRGRENIYI